MLTLAAVKLMAVCTAVRALTAGVMLMDVCRAVIMLTAVVESCGVKCNAYWPDAVGDSRKYSQLTIQLFDIAEVSFIA